MVKLTSLILVLTVAFTPLFAIADLPKQPMIEDKADKLVATEPLSPNTKRVVVFVPGFFNSFAPEYFSTDIVRTFEKKGYVVVIAQKLNPVGTIEDNGERLLKTFVSLKREAPNAEVNVIGHSAGGLYALYAINKGARHVKTLVTVSTPFNGVEFVENWRENSWAFRSLMDLMRLDGLRQLTTPYVQKFIQSVRVPSSLKILAYGGYQPVKLDITNAANITAALTVTDHFITGPSDGIVSFASSTWTTNIPTLEKTMNRVRSNKTFVLDLDHWEQVLDYRNFYLFGVRNPGLIRDRQIKFYSGVANIF